MALFEAVQNNDLNLVQELLQNGASPNEKNDGWTPLHFASIFGYTKIVKELLFFGADYTIQNTKGRDGLHGLSEEQRTLVLEECCSVEVKEPGEE